MNAKMEQYLAINPNPVLSVSKNRTVLYSNEAGEPLLHQWGVRVGEKLPSSIGDLVQRVISRNSPEKIEVKTGNRVYLVSFHPFSEEECVNIYGFDINEYKEIEAQLREAHEQIQIQSEELQVSNEELRVQSDELNEANVLLHDSVTGFRTLAENSPDLIARFDRQNRCLYANPAAMNFYDIPDIVKFYGISVDELSNRMHFEIQIDPEMIKLSEKKRANVFTTSKSETIEFHYISSQGKEYYFDTKIMPEFFNGEVTSTLVISRDITQKKEEEEAMANIETARKKEIHHRIKNNLQVISSLLDIQSEQFKDRDNIKNSEVLEAFKESQDRVISMAMIHEELYKGRDTDTINFSSYIKELTDNLFLTYKLENTEVSYNIDLEENLFFDMDTAVPLGMIVNELISNSFKHAFIGRDEGEIRIKLHREESGERKNEDYNSSTFILTVSDNGVGIPVNLDIENLDSLGLQLVVSLVDQLDGELELKRDNGTEFIIRFTVTEKNNPLQVPANSTSISL